MGRLLGQVVMRPGDTQKATVSGTSAIITNAVGNVNAVRLYLSGATALAFFSFNATATVNDTPIAPDTYYDISIHKGEKISVIGTDGTLYVTEMTQ